MFLTQFTLYIDDHRERENYQKRKSRTVIHILSQELEEILPSILKSVVQENGIKNFFNPLQPGVAFSGGIDKQNRAVMG